MKHTLALPATLLVADDNPRILATVVEMLQGKYRVSSVANGNSAVTEAFASGPDLILLDMDLGDLSGLEVAKRLKQNKCSAKVVFLTIYEDPAFISAAKDAGASGYVFKSRTSQDLLIAVETVLKGERFFSSW
jgi:DNA-binding NarL/FixJ family response regulator